MHNASLLDSPENRLLKPEQAFLTDDCRDVLRFAVEALTSGMRAALVTLVDIHGGAARPLGAQMAVRDDGRYCGFVSGGCVESAASFEAMEAIVAGEDRQVRYGAGSPWFDIVLPCGGGITLSIHVLRSSQPLLAVLNNLEQRQPCGLRYDPHTQTLRSLPARTQTGWRDAGFEVGYRPNVQVLVCGRSVEAQMTASLAQAAGFAVQLSESFPSVDARIIDADTAVVLLWHDLQREIPLLLAAREAAPFYIGALGSHRTHCQRVQKLKALGWRADEIARIKAPIGIFPKARDARSLALSVLADVAAARLASGEA
ncbi:XdhC family protein [Scandinavium sp. V105_16]|uniref:XdhC family protein n=1 Tax=Scandinavium lactucae TaxID=3095028 RepID=A0AAJ2S0Y1_9ENTR|nr:MULTISPECIES: XdhC family protein [unclassified Scandinavium]MDX6019044.1 XdhC family protein [Scandinavium sp. V105_16]MDX6029994.1 XdhC family protein [Scandinavium sp. V105_12]